MGKILREADMNRCIGCRSCQLACARFNYGSFSLKRSAIQIRTQYGLSTGFIADICVACKDRDCMQACPTGAISARPAGGVLLDEKKCNGCKACAAACWVKYIVFDEERGKPIICKHCGICTLYCPHECIKMVENKDEGGIP